MLFFYFLLLCFQRPCLTPLFRAYEEGYQEGIRDGRVAGIQEGSEFGIQTAFQRYIALGVILGRVKVWDLELEMIEAGNYTKSDKDLPKDHDKITKAFVERNKASLASLKSLLNQDKLPMTNSDDDVARLEAIIRKAKSKAKIISSSFRKFKAEMYGAEKAEQMELPLEFHDERIAKLLKPIDEVIEDFRI